MDVGFPVKIFIKGDSKKSCLIDLLYYHIISFQT